MNASTAAARAMVAALPALGVGHVVLCPGSRSAPLAYALYAAEAAGALRLHVRHDERVAAFLALGVGKAGALAAVVTTSGTAVANLHPAVLEAHHAGVPLLVLSADRPHRLRGSWANQASELQASLFAGAVRFAADLPAGGDPDGWTQALAAAVHAARGLVAGTRPGPVHLDLAFEEPLAPDAGTLPWSPPPAAGPAAGPAVAPPAASTAAPAAVPVVLEPGPRTVVVAGDGAGDAAARMAQAAGWPLLAEPSSEARYGSSAVAAPPLLAAHPRLGGRVERVVAYGHPTLSRSVVALLGAPGVEVVQVVTSVADPGPATPVRRLRALAPPAPVADGWLPAWRTAGRVASRALDDVLGDALTGPSLARMLWRALAPGERLVVAASNPVRDLDLAADPWPQAHDRLVLANRGLAGIDGTVATALGVAAAAAGRRTRVLVGDLALLHDVGALVVPAQERAGLDVQVVVLDDDGGGIFSLLEHGDPARSAAFERVFGTPHGVDLGAVAAALGVPAVTVTEAGRLREVLTDPAPGLSLVRVPARRDGRRELQRRIEEAVGSAVDAVLDGLGRG